jgi:hypothetical protein
MSAARACFRRFSSISLESKDFATLRARGSAFVDKTGAIADLLGGVMRDQSCVSFGRPPNFGASLALDIAAEMLAAGPLPRGVAPWPGYAPVDARVRFGGLQVHERLLRRDASLGGLLQRPHFVVKLNLGGVTSGARLEAAIVDQIAGIAEKAFGKALKKSARNNRSPGSALRELVGAVPASVPVALLVDGHDAAIIQDVSEGRWAAADVGVQALNSLAMSTKCLIAGPRIERCIITGVGRYPRPSLFSGANNFEDLTGDPLIARVLGFSEAEIRATFPEELARLAGNLGTDVAGAVAQLAHWFGGYCFDGASTCFSPLPVLSALKAGRIDAGGLEGACNHLWLGVPPATLLAKFGDVNAMRRGKDSFDIDAKKVHTVPLLLQAGLLTLQPRAAPASGAAPYDAPARLLAPNELARRTLRAAGARQDLV